MSENKENCDIGVLTKTPCHLITFTRKNDIVRLETLSKEDLKLLKFRINDFYSICNGTICDHHRYVHLNYFSNLKYKCCDPFAKHNKNVTSYLRILPLEMCEAALNSILLKLVPGDKICKSCFESVQEKIRSVHNDLNNSNEINPSPSCSGTQPIHPKRQSIKVEVNYVSESQQSTISSVSSNVSNLSDYTTLSQDQRKMNTISSCLNLSMLDVDLMKKQQNKCHAKDLVQEVCINFTKILEKAVGITIESTEPVAGIFEDSRILKNIIMNLQKKYASSKSTMERLECLALLPPDWNKQNIREYFKCTDHLYKTLRKLRDRDGKF